MKIYRGQKTKAIEGKTTKVYYEKAFDRNGVGLVCGDKVKIVSIENNPSQTLGNIYTIAEIFQGDLRFNDPYFYCWPNNTVKL